MKVCRPAALLLLVLAAPASAQTLCPPLCPSPTPTAQATATPTAAPAPVRPLAPLTGSVSYQGGPDHAGWIPGDSLVSPLRLRWTRRLTKSSVLSGDGRLYALTETGELHAIDPATGRDLWTARVDASDGAFDDGRIYVSEEHDHALAAYSAADGKQLWRRTFPSENTTPAPVAAGGVVFLETGTYIGTAFDGATGASYWGPNGRGLEFPLAVDETGVYTAGPCGFASAFDRSTGRTRWSVGDSCGGFGYGPALLANSRIYVPSDGGVHAASDGARVGTLPVGGLAVADGVAVQQRRDGRVRGFDFTSGRRLWEDRVPYGGVAGSTAVPFAMGSSVYVLNGGTLAATDVHTGRRRFTAQPQVGPSYGENRVKLAGAPGLLLVSGTTVLTAYESYFSPAPDAVAFATEFGEIFAGRSVRVAGQVGGNRLHSGTVRIEVDRAPFGNGFRPVASVPVGRDGTFFGRLRADRNVRIRATQDGLRSQSATVGVYPDFRTKARQRNGRVHVTLRVRGAHDVPLGGRRAYLYVARAARKRYVRLDGTRLRGARRGRAVGTFTFPPLRRFGQRDTLALCIRHQDRLGLGLREPILRHCGRRSVPFRATP